ncbi:hypothetical protein OROHE_009317 [Orobanche hederae]
MDIQHLLHTFDKPQAILLEETENDAQKKSYASRVSAQGNETRQGSISSGPSSMRGDAIEAVENKKRGMILPFEPHSLTYDDTRYSVDMPT